jgi:hypothetical protein
MNVFPSPHSTENYVDLKSLHNEAKMEKSEHGDDARDFHSK